ncbi:helix-turn-helix protein [Nocardia alba]|uniref:Helix-turn-helix protein n=1 Tax=Nocardia alba TaxID=225051 RepID=A0A4V2PB77_9NOCA|nr:helix-turn-helix protein [Nocardia alba]
MGSVGDSMGKGTVLTILREGGASIRNPRLSEEQTTEAARLYETGQSLARIGERLGADSTTVRRALLKRNIRMRDTHGREQ